MLSFKQYLKVRSEQLVEASSDRRFWFHGKTKKMVRVTTTWHDWEVVKNPEKFKLKRSQVVEFEADVERRSDVIGGIRRLMRLGGWSPLLIQQGTTATTWSIQAESLPEAAAAAKAMSKRNEPDPGRIFMDYGRKSAVLTGGQVGDFIKTGKIIQRTEIGSTMARFR